MRFIFFLVILISNVNAEDKLIQKKLPFDQSNLQSLYTLDDGTKIYIEQFERGDRIWEYNSEDKSFKELTFVWNFIALAKYCEGIKEKNRKAVIKVDNNTNITINMTAIAGLAEKIKDEELEQA